MGEREKRGKKGRREESERMKGRKKGGEIKRSFIL